jgi:tRNA threonylcarbamoyladenosine biosynthesis protein TsaE
LDGDLGVGKTELVRGLAAGAGTADDTPVSSPTYVLLNIYPAGPRGEAKTVFHLDAYRIADESGFDAVGWDDLFGQNALIVVEWAQRVLSLLPHDTLFIAGEWLDGDRRRWTLSASGRHSRALVHAVQRAMATH